MTAWMDNAGRFDALEMMAQHKKNTSTGGLSVKSPTDLAGVLCFEEHALVRDKLHTLPERYVSSPYQKH